MRIKELKINNWEVVRQADLEELSVKWGHILNVKYCRFLYCYYNDFSTIFHLKYLTKELMARPLRIEYSGAYYHVINRGNAGENIFIDERDREKFLELELGSHLKT